MESLPTELKFMILHKIRDINTLSSLVHASPAFHMTYRNGGLRFQIFTAVTLNQLHDRDIDIIMPTTFSELLFCAESTCGQQLSLAEEYEATIRAFPATVVPGFLLELKAAIEAAQEQAQRHNKPITLDYKQCKSLLYIVGIVGWQFKVDESGNGVCQVVTCSRPAALPLRPYERLMNYSILVFDPHTQEPEMEMRDDFMRIIQEERFLDGTGPD